MHGHAGLEPHQGELLVRSLREQELVAFVCGFVLEGLEGESSGAVEVALTPQPVAGRSSRSVPLAALPLCIPANQIDYFWSELRPS